MSKIRKFFWAQLNKNRITWQNLTEEKKLELTNNLEKELNRRIAFYFFGYRKTGDKFYQKEMYEKKYKNYRNKEKINANNKKRRKTDKFFVLKTNCRSLIYQAFKRKGKLKSKKTEKILGCSFNKFKLHIQSKWEPWMNWGNYGNWNGHSKTVNTHWELDHIIPVSSAKTEEDIIRLNHFTNFQPLCSYTNKYIKRDKIAK